MNREEILEKSRRENKNQDVYEQEVLKQSNEVAAFVMVLLADFYGRRHKLRPLGPGLRSKHDNPLGEIHKASP